MNRSRNHGNFLSRSNRNVKHVENSNYREGSGTTNSLETNKRSQAETKSILGISRTAGEGNLLDLLADGVE